MIGSLRKARLTVAKGIRDFDFKANIEPVAHNSYSLESFILMAITVDENTSRWQRTLFVPLPNIRTN
jgi:hypothetical protein